MLPAGSLRMSAYQRGEASLPRVWGVSSNSFLYTRKSGGQGVESDLLGQSTRGLKGSPEMTSGPFRWQVRTPPAPTASIVRKRSRYPRASPWHFLMASFA